jgi:uncharacterized protein (TIGR02246 family)
LESRGKLYHGSWTHINPLGGWTRGRDAVLKQVVVKFATPDVAVATVLSRMSTYTTPNGVKHEREQHIRTFVLVKQNGRWLILQDQNTAVAP